MQDIPEGYQPADIKSSFVRHVGAFYIRNNARGRSVGTRVQEHHCNFEGMAHGAFLMTLADYALSIGSYEPGDAPPKITLSLTTDFAGAARKGDWVEAHVDIQKSGKSVIFANCFICVGDNRIARASGVFKPSPNPNAVLAS